MDADEDIDTEEDEEIRPHLRLWQYPKEGYAGADLSDWYPIVGRTRDADALSTSNFETALTWLREIPGNDMIVGRLRTRWYRYDTDGEDKQAVDVHCAGHWAYGWVDTLMVHKTAAPAILDKAEEILAKLAGYPILDESDYSEREWEGAQNAWRDSTLRWRIELCHDAGISIFAARRPDIPGDDNGEIFQRLRD